jgi:hypothetical protein
MVGVRVRVRNDPRRNDPSDLRRSQKMMRRKRKKKRKRKRPLPLLMRVGGVVVVAVVAHDAQKLPPPGYHLPVVEGMVIDHLHNDAKILRLLPRNCHPELDPDQQALPDHPQHPLVGVGMWDLVALQQAVVFNQPLVGQLQ